MSAMGDVAMTVPVVAAIRRANPSMRITIVTRPFFRPFFADVADVEFADVDLKGRHKGVQGIRLLAKELLAEGVDAVADFHGVLRSHLLRSVMSLHGCRTARIHKGRVEKRKLTKEGYTNTKPLKTSIERYVDVVRRLKIEIDDLSGWTPSERAVPRPFAEQSKTGLWVGVSPFAMHQGKAYPIELMEQAIKQMSPEVERIFVFGGGAEEKRLAEQMEGVADNVQSVVGVMSLDEELSLMANLDVMVAMDSSAMHMSSLVGTQAVTIWGATHPHAGFYGFGQDPANALQAEMPCRPCSVFGNKPCRYGDYRCMLAVSPDEVARKTVEVARKSRWCEKNNAQTK
ncbi:MAG: glycosyltransferase family 9 protein [Rikenellaceae bacterium]|nr:glycosyltransferase family 9 protein [Rikenellaceae bacterium]